MKKVIKAASIFVAIMILSSKIYASTPTPDKHEFKSTDKEINFDVERKATGIALYFQSANFTAYDEVLVERCGSDNGNYSVCKTIEVAQVKISDGYYHTTDNYPLPAQKDCYYRIKTISKEGIMKTFPPVLLTALTR